MTIDKIHYEQLFPTGVYANQRLRVEISLDENDYGFVNGGMQIVSVEDATLKAFNLAKSLVEKAFIELNPQIKWDVTNPLQPIPETQIQKSNDQRRIEVMIKDMEQVKTLEELSHFKFLAKTYPAFAEAYDKKEKELQ